MLGMRPAGEGTATAGDGSSRERAGGRCARRSRGRPARAASPPRGGPCCGDRCARAGRVCMRLVCHGLVGMGFWRSRASSQDANKETSAAEPSATNAAGEAEAATDAASAENAAATKDVASTEAQNSPEPEAAAEVTSPSEPVGPQTFEGTIRIAGGEDAAALCGTDIYAQGEDEAYRIRNTSYAFLVFDQPITIEGVSCDDGVKSFETDKILIGATSDLGWEDAGVLVSALKFMQYSDQRARITCEYLTKTGETAVIDVPRAMYAEVESIL